MQKTDEDIKILWQRYKKNKEEIHRDEIIMNYVPLVKKIVYKMIPNYSRYVDIDDLMGYGFMGLIQSVDKYEIDKGVPFEGFAYRRIKGEIIDYLRRQDFISTSLRQRIKSVENAMAEIEKKVNRAPTEEEICDYLKIDLEDLHKILGNAHTYNVMYLEDALESFLSVPADKTCELPEVRCEKNELKRVLKNCIDTLDEREKLVITLYYYEDLNIREIGEIIGVSESRISQIHSKAIMRLRGSLTW